MAKIRPKSPISTIFILGILGILGGQWTPLATSHGLENLTSEQIAEKMARMPVARKNLEKLEIFSEKDQPSDSERIQRIAIVTQGGDESIFAI